MLKQGLTDFLPCLRKLFNLILSSGIYPSSWATGYITPIFKTGDSSQPENYRGITITSNVGKLFNLVLNSRLDKFLEENKLIDKSQTGFTKNTRTQDHIFVLKTLIDKYTNKAGDKLYACFVDFRKAFDSVIHPGMKLKLKDDTDRWLQLNGPVNFFLFLQQMLFKVSSLNWYKKKWGSSTWFWSYTCLKTAYYVFRKRPFLHLPIHTLAIKNIKTM